jgi:high-affinity K+ transport system ATPase subunit B
MLVVVSLQPFAVYAGDAVSTIVLIALLVCLLPTTIGALLSAIGIAGMDRVTRFNVLAMSGRAVETSGDVDVLATDPSLVVGDVIVDDAGLISDHPLVMATLCIGLRSTR